MSMVDIALALIYFAIIGWFVHKIMGTGNHGRGLLHYAFVGGLGTSLEWATNHYTTTFVGAIGLCIACSCVVEYAIRRIKHRLWVHEVHQKGWHTWEDVNDELHIVPDDLKSYEDIEFDAED